jgi:hypothetical protein
MLLVALQIFTSNRRIGSWLELDLALDRDTSSEQVATQFQTSELFSPVKAQKPFQRCLAEVSTSAEQVEANVTTTEDLRTRRKKPRKNRGFRQGRRSILQQTTHWSLLEARRGSGAKVSIEAGARTCYVPCRVTQCFC